MAPPLHSSEYPNRLHAHPADYFKEDRDVIRSTLTKPFIYTLSGSVGVIAGLLFNFANRRPVWSGIHYHVGFGAAGLVIAHFLYKNREEHLSSRDAMFRHYIELHPEDFPPIERKQFKDILNPWLPVR